MRNAHLDDAQIVALLGDECATDAEQWQLHLAACSACRAELERMRLRLNTISRAIGELHNEPPASLSPTRTGHTALPADSGASMAGRVPAQRRGSVRSSRSAHSRRLRPSWRLARAAVITMLIGSIAFVDPVRARLVGWVAAAAAQLGGRGSPPRPHAPPSPAVSTAVRVTPSGVTIVLEFASAQDHGSVVLRRGSESELVLQIEPGTDAPATLVADGVLRVRNVAGDSAGYVLLVPPVLRRVDVVIGGRTVTSVRLDDLEGDLVVPLR